MNNYIKHSTPTNVNYNKWVETYALDISRIFVRFLKYYNSRYNKEIKANVVTFNVFCRFLFESSSKYIMKYNKK